MTMQLLLYLLAASLVGVLITSLFFRGQRGPAIKAATAESRNETAQAKDRLERQKKVNEEVIREKIRLSSLVEELTAELRKETAARATAEMTSNQIGELNETIRLRDASISHLREVLAIKEQEKAALETTVKTERQAAAEKLEILEKTHKKLPEAFKAISEKVIESNKKHFSEIAKTAFEKLQGDANSDLEAREKVVADIVAPVRETLAKVDANIQDIENARLSAYGTLTEQIKNLGSAQDHHRNETSKLVKALRTPVTRGSWGEMQLRRVAEIAGMQEHCDFDEPTSVEASNGSLRPDMIVRLPGGKSVVVDAKTPLSAYLDACESDDDEHTRAKLADHARQIRERITALANEAYSSQLQSPPEFVVLFLPGEMFFNAALKEDASLIEHGASQQVILATPTTLIAVLKAVACGWREEHLANNARAMSDLGQELYARISTLANQWSQVGRNLDSAVDAYNTALVSLESRVLASARKFKELDAATAGQDIVAIEPLERTSRDLKSPEFSRSRKAAGNGGIDGS